MIPKMLDMLNWLNFSPSQIDLFEIRVLEW